MRKKTREKLQGDDKLGDNCMTLYSNSNVEIGLNYSKIGDQSLFSAFMMDGKDLKNITALWW